MRRVLVLVSLIFLILSLSVFVSAIQITGRITSCAEREGGGSNSYCADGVDNDCDGLIDEADSDCECIDSEQAYNPNLKGTIRTRNGTVLEDKCSEDGTLLESYCLMGNNTFTNIVTCPQGYVCSDGACVPISTVLCTDSDGGANLYVKGTATDGSGTETDSCYADGALAEYTCLNNYFKKKGYFPCPNGYKCSDGTCVPASNVPCVDSDGGSNLKIKGTTTDSSGSSTDFCYQNNAITEYYCLNDYSKGTINIRCSGGEICIDGACVINSSLWEGSPCNDSDGGNNIYVRGETKTTKEEVGFYKEHVDECKYEENHVEEGVCNYLGRIEIYGYACPQGFICNNGACVLYSNQTYGEGDSSLAVNSNVKDLTKYSPPTVSIEQAISMSNINNSQIEDIELTEESGKLIYSVSETKQAKLFGIIPISVKIKNRISTETGDILSIQKPWWSFLVSGL